MKNSLLSNIGLAFFRICMSGMMITHGFGKFQNLISGDIKFGNPIGIGEAPSLFLAVIGEFVCPILIIIGFKTRWAAIPTAITMAVAAFIAHGADPFGKKEMALMYLVTFITIALVGPGKFSIDKK
ncbi:DoxX family protein [Maribacter sp. CXY002]|uniref:DoxX family protein n=1 Tax=Maribacter luteocoastalis TaxID=3407671 RepID=UPI003B6825AC